MTSKFGERDVAQAIEHSGVKGLDPPTWRIDPLWRMHLQFGLLSVPISGPKPVHQSAVLSFGKCI